MTSLKVIDGKRSASKNNRIDAAIETEAARLRRKKYLSDGNALAQAFMSLEPDIYDLDRAARLAECALDDDEMYRFAAEQLCDRVQALKAKYCKLIGD
jgi:hypothetical protein